ncbi:hypothetical protein L1267_23545 [Pseudoalteromonas sp. OFAV1]|uniref:hypothetical protein n=1 Tax=Pseudoalteromonas sp. OFAV1 TaxID=2908892 RepID=UPI001F26DA7F|nr:hypothetical protein [Pseudoalteromonas sp. OFAV1]MCF2903346.1 hypothetical protein [Pseudoalteromonas sp. OFAV1]
MDEKQIRANRAYLCVLMHADNSGTANESIEAKISALLSDLKLLCDDYGITKEAFNEDK